MVVKIGGGEATGQLPSPKCSKTCLVEYYTTQSALKVVHNSLFYSYLTYFILSWGRALNATVQPLIKLQNKAVKLIRSTNKTSLEESFQHLNILCLPKLYTLSVGKFMHSYHSKIDDNFIPISSIRSYFTKLSTSQKLSTTRFSSSLLIFSKLFLCNC